MGCDCEVTPYQANKIDGDYVAPFYHMEPTEDDLKENKAYEERRDAIATCRAAGVDEKTIQALLK